jgi:hypothetical protein
MRFLVLLALATAAQAQTVPGAVMAKSEPHHHLAYEDSTLRVLRVRVPAHDSTVLHEHDADYFWIALGSSSVVNAKVGAPDATIASQDLSIHYTPGKFAHVARNPGDEPFDNITIELLRPQTTPKNLCEAAVADKPLSCRNAVTLNGVTQRPAFMTDQLRVNLVTIDPGQGLTVALGGLPAWIIALDTADVNTALTLKGPASWVGGTIRADSAGRWVLRNEGTKPVRALTVFATVK